MALPNYSEQGEGEVAVFLLHGVGGGHAAWASNAPALASAGYRCIAWDMPGYGQSKAVAPYTMDALAESLLALMAHVGAKSNVLLGHSMGGMVAQQAMALQASKVHGAILFATSAAFAPPAKPGQTAQDAAHWSDAFLRSRFAPLDAGLGMVGLAGQLVSGMFSPDTSNQAALNQAIDMMARVPEATYRAALATIATFDQRVSLANIAVPLLCLAAELDKNAPPRVLEKMAADNTCSNPTVSYACLRGVGHLANMEQPEAFNACVLEFLKRYFQTSRPRLDTV